MFAKSSGCPQVSRIVLDICKILLFLVWINHVGMPSSLAITFSVAMVPSHSCKRSFWLPLSFRCWHAAGRTGCLMNWTYFWFLIGSKHKWTQHVLCGDITPTTAASAGLFNNGPKSKSQLNPSQVMSYEPKPVTLEALCLRDTRESHGTLLVVSPPPNALLSDCVTARYGIADSVTPADNSWLRAPQFEDQSAAWEKRRADSLNMRVNGQWEEHLIQIDSLWT